MLYFNNKFLYNILKYFWGDFVRKFLVLLFALILALLTSCSENTTSSHPDIVVNLPDGSIANGQTSLPDSIDKDTVSVGKPDVIVDYYVGSSTTKKFHLKDCTWAQKLKEENKVYFSGYNEFIKNGFTPCKTCNP